MLFHRFSNLVHEAFDDDPRFLTARDKAFSKIVNTELVSQTELATVENVRYFTIQYVCIYFLIENHLMLLKIRCGD